MAQRMLSVVSVVLSLHHPLMLLLGWGQGFAPAGETSETLAGA